MRRMRGMALALALALCAGLAACGAGNSPEGQLQIDERKPLQSAAPVETATPGQEPSADVPAEALVSTPGPETTYAAALAAAFAETGALDEMAPYSELDLLDYYGIDAARCESVAGYTDAVGYTNELVVVQADETVAAEIESLLAGYLEARETQFAGYDADAAAMVKKAVLRRDGGVVLMIISPEAEALLEVYRGFTF